MPKLVIYNEVLKTSHTLDVDFSNEFLQEFVDSDVDK